MERRLIGILTGAMVFCFVSTGLWMTAWAEVLVPAMDMEAASVQTEKDTVGIEGAIVEETPGTAAAAEEAGETASAVKTAGKKSKTGGKTGNPGSRPEHVRCDCRKRRQGSRSQGRGRAGRHGAGRTGRRRKESRPGSQPGTGPGRIPGSL